MALFKILKGPEKKDSTGKSVMLDPAASGLAIREGWAYVTDAGNFYVDISDTTRVKINQNADYANVAYNDSANQLITSTYIKKIEFLTTNEAQTGAASNPYLKYTLGNGTPKVLALPAASTAHGGILTLDQQDLMGLKTFWDGIRQSVTLAPTNNLDYSVGYYTYTTNADGKTITTSLNLGGLTYNPNTKTLSADNFYGLSAKATADASDQTITSTYIKDIKYFSDGSSPYYTLILGDGTTKKDPNDTTGKNPEKITIPVADTTNAGIVTIAKQTFAGEKTFNSLITAASGLQSNENITTKKQFVSTLATGTAPFQVASSTVVSGLNVDMVDGLHASNTPFTSGSASQTILPTQHAIWTSFNSLLTAAQALVYRGTIDPNNSNTHPTSGLVNGDTYVITAEGNFAGVYCEPGDLAIYCNSSWDIIQVNINGAVTIKGGGAYNTAHTTDHAIARFDGTTGRIIQNSSILIDDNGNILPTTDKKQTIGSATAIWGTIYGTATHATSDDKNQNIAATYIKEIEFVQSDAAHSGSTSNPALKYLRGTGVNPVFLPIPAAGPQKGGIITAGQQEISGAKTLNAADGSLTIPRANSFIYSGIQVDNGKINNNTIDTNNTAKYIWFSTTGGIPKYNESLAFNPYCSTSWTSYDSTTVTPYTELKVDRVNGISLKALQDSNGLVISKTYIKQIDFVVDESTKAGSVNNPCLRHSVGDNSTVIIDFIPAASASQGGILTASNQEIKGKKIFNDSIATQLTLATDNSGAYYPWFSTVSSSKIGSPAYDTGLSYNPNTHTLTTTTFVGNLTGIATQAVKDGNGKGNTIADYYMHNITLDSTGHVFDLKNGNNISLGTVSPKFAGSSSCGGAATSAVKLDKSITLSLTGDISGSATFDGSSSFSIATTINNNGIFYVDGSSSTTAGNWIGTNTNIAALTPGLTIAYKIGIAGSTTTTLTLTISSGTTGAITIKRNASNLTTHLPVGTVVLLTYDGTNWCWADYDSSTPNLRVYRQTVDYNGDYPILVSRTALGSIGTVGTNGSSSNVYAVIGQDGTYTPTINPYTGVVKITATTASTSTTTGALIVSGGIGAAGNIYGNKVYNAVWNDYAEFRKAETLEPGRVIIEDASGEMKLSSERLQPGASIISDTFGSAMGETEECKTPIAVAGRALAYYYGDINMYTVGAAVGTGPNGTVSLMTREEIMTYPDRIVGIVSEIPSYKEWGPEHIKVNGRIWIKIK